MESDPSQMELDEAARRDLVRLADGSLEGDSRAGLEARLAGSVSLRAALERQRAGAAALRGLELEAPAALRARIAARTASPTGVRARHRGRPRRVTLGAGLVGAVAAAALAAALILPSGSASPSINDASRLAERPPTEAVKADPANARLLAAAVQGVPFPNWSREFGWHQVGTRADHLGDREARTVLYRHEGKRIAYTIVSGHGIRAPSRATTSVRKGVKLHAFEDQGRRVVTWWRQGRTCVLTASEVGDRELLELASWKGDGAVPF